MRRLSAAAAATDVGELPVSPVVDVRWGSDTRLPVLVLVTVVGLILGGLLELVELAVYAEFSLWSPVGTAVLFFVPCLPTSSQGRPFYSAVVVTWVLFVVVRDVVIRGVHRSAS